MLGPQSQLGMEGTEQSSHVMAIVMRFNAISEELATTPKRSASIFERTDDGTVRAEP